MENYDFLIVLAIILLSTKIFGVLSARVHMPQVVGSLLVGIVLGPSLLNVVGETDFLIKTAEIGVIMLMFMAGLETDFEELKKTGSASFVIALIGVIIPLVGGFLSFHFFFSAADKDSFYRALFIGVLLTATSVSITVETLKEMGKVSGKVGTAILGAAIIDDILGIIALTAITSVSGGGEGVGIVLVRIACFFVFVGIVGIIMHIAFVKMDTVYNHKRRLAIYALAFCLAMSYCAEEFFGVADITGAYFSGLILCNITDTKNYVNRKISISSYMLFAPVFFASIGLKTQLSGFTPKIFAFSIILLIVALLSKVVGCGVGALFCGFNKQDALSVGVGMISRGEVALIVAQKGEAVGLISPDLFPAIVMVVIVTTLVTPILLKIAMSREAAEAV